MVKTIAKVLGAIVGIVVLAAVIGIGILTVTEFKPEEEEALDIAIKGTGKALEKGESFSVISWNIGYASLGKDADFFMDGGTSVMGDDSQVTKDNLTGIVDVICQENPDILMLQEVDLDSKRSFHINERDVIKEGTDFANDTFAYNYKTLYVPYPWPTIGKVQAGLLTLSDYEIESATRMALPCPFSWPVSTVNLKRCLNINRMKVQDSDKELVIINLHLEAYDDGEGKAAQTKMLTEVLQQEYEKGNYVIAAGDFNQTFSNITPYTYEDDEELWQPATIDLSQLPKETLDSFSFLMDNEHPSCRLLSMPYNEETKEKMRYYFIDGFIVSNNIEVESMEGLEEDFVYSDHNPIKLVVSLQ